MSRETMEHLNRYQLIGLTADRGPFWHADPSLQGDEPNHYMGFIPAGDVVRRLFDFDVIGQPVYIATGIGADGQAEFAAIPNRQAIVAQDDKSVLGIFTDGYQFHGYREWLVDLVPQILSTSYEDVQRQGVTSIDVRGEDLPVYLSDRTCGALGITSAGLLRNRGVAYVQCELPESVTTPEGVEYFPFLLATTSGDGTAVTQFKKGARQVGCDNTRDAFLRADGERFKVKHTRHSVAKLADARDALAIVFSAADEFAAEVAALCAVSVTDQNYSDALDVLVPVPTDKGRGQTLATKKRDALSDLWTLDARVTPWRGSAFGAVQAWNTYNQHMTSTRKGVSLADRTLESFISGGVAKSDRMMLDALVTVGVQV